MQALPDLIQLLSNQVERPLDLAMPQSPSDAFNGVGEQSAAPPILVGRDRSAAGRLRDALNSHRQMEPVQHVTCRAWAGRLAERARPPRREAPGSNSHGMWSLMARRTNLPQRGFIAIGVRRPRKHMQGFELRLCARCDLPLPSPRASLSSNQRQQAHFELWPRPGLNELLGSSVI
jgi:hypothetical protein